MSVQKNEINRIAYLDGWRAAARVAAGRADDPSYQFEYITSEARADFRVLMPHGHDDIVLDIGSGWGNITVAFARTSKHVFALDKSNENLEFIRIRSHQEGIKNITLIQADAEEIPLPSNSCNIALMVGALEWVAWGKSGSRPQKVQEKVLNNICAKLTPGGCLYIGIENRYSYKYILGNREPHTGLRFISLLPMPIANLYSRLSRGYEYREITYSLRGMVHILKQAGFSHVKIMFPIPGYQNFRYITDYKTTCMAKFLFHKLRSHPKFTNTHYIASRLALAFRLHKLTAPCFSVFAYKGDNN